MVFGKVKEGWGVCVCVLIVATPWGPSLGEHPRGAKVNRCDPPSGQVDATPLRLRQWPSRRRPAPRGSGPISEFHMSQVQRAT